MEPLALKHIDPQVHARYMTHGKPVPPRTLTMIDGKTTSLLFSGNPKDNGRNNALSLDAARKKQTTAKLKNKRRRTHSTRAALCQNHANRNAPQIIPAGLRRIEANLRPLRTVDDLPSASRAKLSGREILRSAPSGVKQNLDTTTAGPLHTSSTTDSGYVLPKRTQRR